MRTYAPAAWTALAAGLLLAPLPAVGQLSHALPASDGGVELAVAKPFFENGDAGAATGVLLARAAIPTSGDFSLFAEWGVSHGTYAGSSGNTTTSNLALGAAFGSAEATSGSVMVSLPVASESGDDDFATFVGLFTDPDHLERFLPDVWAAEAAVRSLRMLDSGSAVGIRVAGTVMGSSQEGADTELYTRYSAFGRVPAGSAHLGAEISGVAILSEGGLDLGERTFHHLTAFAGLPEVGGAPELYVRIPLDSDFNDVVTAVVGVRVTF